MRQIVMHRAMVRAEPVAEFDEVEPLVVAAHRRVAPDIEGPVFVNQRLDGPFCHAWQDSMVAHHKKRHWSRIFRLRYAPISAI